ncbi:MAG: hypothetical protein JXB13_10670 [Phycisphaerae bacterium]|nr:hypothetical protein [Phycisphaerae bacterium]
MHVEVRAMRLCVSELEKDIRQTRGDMADTIIRAACDLANAVNPELLHLAAEHARVQEAEALAGNTPREVLELAHLMAQLRKAEEKHPPETPD